MEIVNILRHLRFLRSATKKLISPIEEQRLRRKTKKFVIEEDTSSHTKDEEEVGVQEASKELL